MLRNLFSAFFILFLITFHHISASAQPLSWEWAGSGDGMYHDFVEDMVIDHNGNCIVTGKLSGDTLVFGSFTLTNQGPFVVKYSATGSVLWAKSYQHGGAYGIAVDANNDIYFTGYFDSQTIQFDSFVLTRVGYMDMFLVKLDSAGNVLWAKSAGSTGADIGMGVATDPGGYVYVTGTYSGDIVFGTDTLNIDFDKDVFVAKYDFFGNPLWAKAIKGDDEDGVSKIAVDQNGDVLVAGQYQSSVLPCGTDTLVNLVSGVDDIFLVKLNPAGNFIWSRSFGGYSWETCYDMAVTATNQIYLTGYYLSAYFNIDSINTINIEPGISDAFVLKFNENGILIRSQTFGGTLYDHARSVACDSADNIYVTGIYSSGSLDFGSTTLTNTNLSGNEIFVAKFDAAGINNWAINVGDSNDNWSKKISMYNNESIYITGTFNSDSLHAGPFVLPGNGNTLHTVFTAKLSDLNTALHETDKNNPLQIYPNPGTGLFHVVSLPGQLHLYNSIGQEIYSTMLINEKNLIDISEYADGIYFVTIQTPDELYSQKILLSR